MNNRTKRVVGLLALAALAAPALAVAERPGPDNPGQHEARGHDRGAKHEARAQSNKPRPWNVHGQVVGKGDSTVTVKIRRSSRLPRAMREREVTFDLSQARISVPDRNGDGQHNLADVNVGDRAHIKARLPRRQSLDGVQNVPARLAIFRAPRGGDEQPGQQPPAEQAS
jgi:hypothetical protein